MLALTSTTGPGGGQARNSRQHRRVEDNNYFGGSIQNKYFDSSTLYFNLKINRSLIP